MADSRRRSPDSSRRRRSEGRRDSREYTANRSNMPSYYTDQQPQQQHQQPRPYVTPQNSTPQSQHHYEYQQYSQQRQSQSARRSRAPSSSSSSGSTNSSSLMDISRFQDTKTFGGVFSTFFRAPSERRRVRRRRSGKKKSRVLYFGNSSSSSVNSDLAYGTGRSRDFSQQHTPTHAPVQPATYAAAHHSSPHGQNPPYYQQQQQQQQPQPQPFFNNEPHRPLHAEPQSINPVGVAAAGAAAGVAASAALGLAADYYHPDVQIPSKPATPQRRKTDDEIMAIGRQLSDLAKRQNEEDLRARGVTRPSRLVSAAAKIEEYRKLRKSRKNNMNRGLVYSKPHRDSSDDDSDWESASDDDSSEDSADSEMAYGTVVSQAIRPSTAAIGAAGAAAAYGRYSNNNNNNSRPGYGNRNVVDPTLFGPYNSLRGMINTPCGFGDERNGAAQHKGPNPLKRSSTEPLGPMHNVYPMPTSDPLRFNAGRDPRHEHTRPAPVPLQHPAPRTPVPDKVFRADKIEDVSRRESARDRSDSSPGFGKMAAGAAAAGVAAAVIGGALTKDKSKDDHESRDHRNGDDKDREKRSRRADREDENDTESRKSRPSSQFRDEVDKYARYANERSSKSKGDKSSKSRDDKYSQYSDDRASKYDDDRGYKYDDDKSSKSREKSRDSKYSGYADDKVSKYDDDKYSKYSNAKSSKRDDKVSKYEDDKYSKSRDDKHSKYGDDKYSKYEDDKYSKYRDDKYSKYGDDRYSKYGESSKSKDYEEPSNSRELPALQKLPYESTPASDTSSKAPVDPFQFQVDNFMTPAVSDPARPLTPMVVTVDREPVFDDDSPPYTPPGDRRMSRKDSFELEQQYQTRAADEFPSFVSRVAPAVVPAAAAAVAAGAIVAASKSDDVPKSTEPSRERKKESRSRSRSERKATESKDEIQEQADRYYREAEQARKKASEEIRSRSPSPEAKGNEREHVRVVTPPGYRERTKGLFDGPNADVLIDHMFFPQESERFRTERRLDGSFASARDPSADGERPVLNLTYPTPESSRAPSSSREPDPAPEKEPEKEPEWDNVRDVEPEANKRRDYHDDTSRSDVGTRRSNDERDDTTSTYVIGAGSYDQVTVAPPTPKSVKWGENETKSYEVITPEARDDVEHDFSRSQPDDKPRPRLEKGSQWGMMAAALAAGAAGAAGTFAGSIIGSKSREDDDAGSSRSLEKQSTDGSFDKLDDLMDAPPVPGPKPASPKPEHMPGGYADDIEFAATLAAGLKHTGFDANIVIDDPTYHRRDSPPGSNELNGKHYYPPAVDSVSDLSLQEKHRGPEPGFVLGEVETPKDESLPFQDTEDSALKKLSKKERKRLAKLAKESSDVADASQVSYEPESQSRAIYEDPEQAEPEPKLSKKEKRRREKAARESILDGQDSDGQIYAEPEPLNHSEASWENWEDTSDLKSRVSRARGIDSSEHSLVSAPIGSPSEVRSSRAIHSDDEWESTKKSKKKSKRSSGYDSPSRDLPVRSATASEVGVEDSGKKSRKSKRRSGTDDDFYRYDDERRSRTRDLFEDREVSSIVSEPRTEDRQRKSRSSKTDYRYDDDDTKSVASAPGSSRKSRESERSKEPDRRSSGLFSSIFKSSKDGEKQKKDSFLGNAGTFGAGVGILGIGAAALTPFNANNAFSEKKTDHEDISEWSRNVENYDPDIVARAIKPAIDPQYGDLLPLPPSEPGTPVGTPEELPTLPDSRPDTPPEERAFRRDRPFHNRRRSAQETPSKTPSNTAIPIQLRMGGRSGPSSPALFKASPISSPVVGMAESPTRSSPTVVRRPTSWDSSREFKPLYLVEHSRHISIDAPILEADLPPLPPSESSARGSPPESEGWESAHEYAQAMNDRGFDYGHYGDNSGLRLDTSLPLAQPTHDEAGSQESTPKAETRPEFPDMSSLPRALDQGEPSTLGSPIEMRQPEPEPVESTSRDRSSYLLQSAPSSEKSIRSIRGDFDDYRLPEAPNSPTRRYGAEEMPVVGYKDDLASGDDHFSDAHDISSVRSVELISDTVKGKGKSVEFVEPWVAEDVSTSGDALAIERAPAAEDASVIEKTPATEEISSIEKAPATEAIPVVGATPIVEEVLSVEKAAATGDVPVIEATPIVEEVSAEKTPATEDVSVIEKTPVVEEVSFAEKAPATEEISSTEKTPVVEEVSATEDISVIENTPTVEEAPVVEKVPVTKEISSIEKAPITEETSVEQAPVAEETPITKEVPVTGEEEPTAEELSKMSAKDRKKAKRAAKKRAEALALGATEDVSVAETAPAAEVVPVIESTPALEEAPATEDVSVADNVPATEEISSIEKTPVTEEISSIEKALATEDVSAAEKAPATEEISSIEKAPVAEEISSVEKAPLTEATPVTKEVPGEEEPTAEELSKMSAKDRKKAKRAAKKRAEALALGLAAGVAVGVAANTSKSTESETPAPTEEETSALEQAPANDKAITTEEIPPVENAPIADEASTTEKALNADEAPTAEIPPTTEEIPLTDNAPFEDEALTTEKAVVADETPIAENVLTTEETPMVEEVPTTDDAPITEKALVAEDAPTPENLVITEEVPTTEKLPTAAEVALTEEVPTAEQVPAVEEVPSTEQAPRIDETPIAEEALAPKGAPPIEEAPVTEDTSIAKELPATAETSTEEAPTKEEAPAVEEAPTTEEAPAIEEAPRKEEALASEEPTIAKEAPATEEPPTTEEAITPKDIPAITEDSVPDEVTRAKEVLPMEEAPATEKATIPQDISTTPDASVVKEGPVLDDVATSKEISALEETPVVTEDPAVEAARVARDAEIAAEEAELAALELKKSKKTGRHILRKDRERYAVLVANAEQRAAEQAAREASTAEVTPPTKENAEETPSTKEAPATEETVEEAPVAQEHSVTETATETSVAQDIPATETTEEAPVVKDVSATDGTTEETAVSKEATATEAAGEETPIAEEIPVPKEAPTVEEASSAEQAIEETPVPTDVSITEKTAEETPIAEDIPAVETAEETPIVEEIPATDETAAEAPAPKEIAATEQPSEEAPIIAEPPAIEETVEVIPVSKEASYTEEISAPEEPPVAKEAPIVKEDPAIEAARAAREAEIVAEEHELAALEFKKLKRGRLTMKKDRERYAVLQANAAQRAAEKEAREAEERAAREAPIDKDVPAVKEAPAEEAPVTKEIPTTEESTFQAAPITNEGPVTEEVPAAKTDDISASKEVPAVEEEPTAEELSKMSAKDRKKAKRAAKKRADALASETATDSQIPAAADETTPATVAEDAEQPSVRESKSGGDLSVQPEPDTSAEVVAGDEKSIEDKPLEDKPAEEKPFEDKLAEDKLAEDKPVEDKPVEDKPTEDKPAENKPAEDQPAEGKLAEDKPAEDQPAEDKPVDELSTALPEAVGDVEQPKVESHSNTDALNDAPSETALVEETATAKTTQELEAAEDELAEPKAESQPEPVDPETTPKKSKKKKKKGKGGAQDVEESQPEVSQTEETSKSEEKRSDLSEPATESALVPVSEATAESTEAKSEQVLKTTLEPATEPVAETTSEAPVTDTAIGSTIDDRGDVEAIAQSIEADTSNDAPPETSLSTQEEPTAEDLSKMSAKERKKAKKAAKKKSQLAEDASSKAEQELKEAPQEELKEETKEETKEEAKAEPKEEAKEESKDESKKETKEEAKEESKEESKEAPLEEPRALADASSTEVHEHDATQEAPTDDLAITEQVRGDAEFGAVPGEPFVSQDPVSQLDEDVTSPSKSKKKKKRKSVQLDDTPKVSGETTGDLESKTEKTEDQPERQEESKVEDLTTAEPQIITETQQLSEEPIGDGNSTLDTQQAAAATEADTKAPEPTDDLTTSQDLISEPLFSQNERQAEATEEPSSTEPTQVTVPVVEEPEEATSSKKKKNKKKKSKQAAAELDVSETPTPDITSIPGDQEQPSGDKETPSATVISSPAPVPKAEVDDNAKEQKPKDDTAGSGWGFLNKFFGRKASDQEPQDVPRETKADTQDRKADGQGASDVPQISRETDAKTEKSKSGDFGSLDTPDAGKEDPKAEAPGSSDIPIGGEVTADTEESKDETPAAEAQDKLPGDEPLSPTSKKAKKKAKKQQARLSLGSTPETPPETTQDTAPDPAEEAVKVVEQPEAVEQNVKDEQTIPETTEVSTVEPEVVAESGEAQPEEASNEPSTDPKLDAEVPAPEQEAEAETSKKSKKKKKKKGGADSPVQLPNTDADLPDSSLQETDRTPDTGRIQDSGTENVVDHGAEKPSSFVIPAEEISTGLESEAQDDRGGFNSKNSETDEQNKKAKEIESEETQDPESTALSEPDANSSRPQDDAYRTIEPSSIIPSDAVSDPSQISNLNPVEESTGAAGLSKKERKKLKQLKDKEMASGVFDEGNSNEDSQVGEPSSVSEAKRNETVMNDETSKGDETESKSATFDLGDKSSPAEEPEPTTLGDMPVGEQDTGLPSTSQQDVLSDGLPKEAAHATNESQSPVDSGTSEAEARAAGLRAQEKDLHAYQEPGDDVSITQPEPQLDADPEANPQLIVEELPERNLSSVDEAVAVEEEALEDLDKPLSKKEKKRRKKAQDAALAAATAAGLAAITPLDPDAPDVLVAQHEVEEGPKKLHEPTTLEESIPDSLNIPIETESAASPSQPEMSQVEGAPPTTTETEPAVAVEPAIEEDPSVEFKKSKKKKKQKKSKESALDTESQAPISTDAEGLLEKAYAPPEEEVTRSAEPTITPFLDSTVVEQVEEPREVDKSGDNEASAGYSSTRDPLTDHVSTDITGPSFGINESPEAFKEPLAATKELTQPSQEPVEGWEAPENVRELTETLKDPSLGDTTRPASRSLEMGSDTLISAEKDGGAQNDSDFKELPTELEHASDKPPPFKSTATTDATVESLQADGSAFPLEDEIPKEDREDTLASGPEAIIEPEQVVVPQPEARPEEKSLEDSPLELASDSPADAPQTAETESSPGKTDESKTLPSENSSLGQAVETQDLPNVSGLSKKEKKKKKKEAKAKALVAESILDPVPEPPAEPATEPGPTLAFEDEIGETSPVVKPSAEVVNAAEGSAPGSRLASEKDDTVTEQLSPKAMGEIEARAPEVEVPKEIEAIEASESIDVAENKGLSKKERRRKKKEEQSKVAALGEEQTIERSMDLEEVIESAGGQSGATAESDAKEERQDPGSSLEDPMDMPVQSAPILRPNEKDDKAPEAEGKMGDNSRDLGSKELSERLLAPAKDVEAAEESSLVFQDTPSRVVETRETPSTSQEDIQEEEKTWADDRDKLGGLSTEVPSQQTPEEVAKTVDTDKSDVAEPNIFPELEVPVVQDSALAARDDAPNAASPPVGPDTRMQEDHDDKTSSHMTGLSSKEKKKLRKKAKTLGLPDPFLEAPESQKETSTALGTQASELETRPDLEASKALEPEASRQVQEQIESSRLDATLTSEPIPEEPEDRPAGSPDVVENDAPVQIGPPEQSFPPLADTTRQAERQGPESAANPTLGDEHQAIEVETVLNDPTSKEVQASDTNEKAESLKLTPTVLQGDEEKPRPVQDKPAADSVSDAKQLDSNIHPSPETPAAPLYQEQPQGDRELEVAEPPKKLSKKEKRELKKQALLASAGAVEATPDPPSIESQPILEPSIEPNVENQPSANDGQVVEASPRLEEDSEALPPAKKSKKDKKKEKKSALAAAAAAAAAGTLVASQSQNTAPKETLDIRADNDRSLDVEAAPAIDEPMPDIPASVPAEEASLETTPSGATGQKRDESTLEHNDEHGGEEAQGSAAQTDATVDILDVQHSEVPQREPEQQDAGESEHRPHHEEQPREADNLSKVSEPKLESSGDQLQGQPNVETLTDTFPTIDKALGEVDAMEGIEPTREFFDSEMASQPAATLEETTELNLPQPQLHIDVEPVLAESHEVSRNVEEPTASNVDTRQTKFVPPIDTTERDSDVLEGASEQRSRRLEEETEAAKSNKKKQKKDKGKDKQAVTSTFETSMPDPATSAKTTVPDQTKEPLLVENKTSMEVDIPKSLEDVASKGLPSAGDVSQDIIPVHVAVPEEVPGTTFPGQSATSERDILDADMHRKTSSPPRTPKSPRKPLSDLPKATSPKRGLEQPPSTETKEEGLEKTLASAASAAAAATASGFSFLAGRFGGWGNQKKDEKPEVVDKRTSREKEVVEHDDHSSSKGVEKKKLREQADGKKTGDKSSRKPTEVKDSLTEKVSLAAKESDDFWKSHDDHVTVKGKGKAKLETSVSRDIDDFKLTKSASKGKAIEKEAAKEKSPSSHRGIAGLLRREPDTKEPAGKLFEEDTHASSTLGRGFDSTFVDTRASPTHSLPVVEEVPESDAPKISRAATMTPDTGRRRLRRSSYGTPVLEEPVTTRATPDPEKKRARAEPVTPLEKGEPSPLRLQKMRSGPSLRPSSSRRRLGEAVGSASPSLRRLETRDLRSPSPASALKSPSPASPPSLLPAAGVAAAAALGVGAMAGALRSTGSPDETMRGRRSVSDNSNYQRRAPGQRESPQSAGSAERGGPRRSASNTSLLRKHTPEPLKFRPETPGIQGVRSTPTPPPSLRRVDKRVSGDLRSLRQQNNSTPVANERRVRTKDMGDVYDGVGEGRIGSPRSPTRPHSMRRRQSMQVLELESRVEQLIAENQQLTAAREQAEQGISHRSTSVLAERDAQIESLKQSLQFLQNEVSRLTEVNNGLTSANAELAHKDKTRYADLEVRHADVTRELDLARGEQNAFQQTIEDKDAEIADLRAQLESAKEQIREMQRQILESKSSDAEFLNLRDEDHFDHRCQQLCSHVQQWVLRFSKFSDMRACRLTSEINDEKTIDRLDNAVLDGSDVDRYLSDRVKRRDIFMSMTMNMVWEFVFTRYLFGMDREQRQKLKSLEKMLTDVGPPQAVRQWRAVTLTLLSRRDTFKHQRDQDTEAVVQAIFQTLSRILPPPGNLESQIQSQLRRVLREAVDLSIEMRTQKAEYMMLPPLQPEYDADGELSATVQFNASMMSDRNSKGLANDELEAEGAIVRVVLFPLVVKKGDDEGVGDDEIVVCPAQVIVAGDNRHNFGASSELGGTSLGARSRLSVVTDKS
ncbi:unnamed protein product [Clonostachys byssicola]|uniref:Involucrin repeat protein n=1 Tax=Clonostachys byssicola TaxID=160290 RepID=A0A9N9U268_9HYPO|nr:unnamed protein product [Clonostachys byssicola]